MLKCSDSQKANSKEALGLKRSFSRQTWRPSGKLTVTLRSNLMTKEAPLQAIVKRAARWQLWLNSCSKAGVHSKSKSAHLSLPIIGTASAAEGATWAEAECMRFHVCVCMVRMEIRHWGCMRTWLRCAKSPLGTSIQKERETEQENNSSGRVKLKKCRMKPLKLTYTVQPQGF